MRLRTLSALLSAALLSALVGAPAVADASPVSGTAPLAYPPSVCSTISVSTTRPTLGEAITVTGLNFEPNVSVTLRLEPRTNANAPGAITATYPAVRTDARGSFTTRITMPDATADTGAYVVIALSGFTRSGSCPADPSVDLVVGALAAGGGGSSSGNGGTAFTGLDIAALLAIAALLLAGGGALVHRGRRSRTV